MAVYNLSNFTSADNLLELAVAADGLTGGALFAVVLMLILLISFVAQKQAPASSAIISSTFITFVLSAILWTVNLVGDAVAIVFFLFFVMSVAAKAILR